MREQVFENRDITIDEFWITTCELNGKETHRRYFPEIQGLPPVDGAYFEPLGTIENGAMAFQRYAYVKKQPDQTFRDKSYCDLFFYHPETAELSKPIDVNLPGNPSSQVKLSADRKYFAQVFGKVTLEKMDEQRRPHQFIVRALTLEGKPLWQHGIKTVIGKFPREEPPVK